MAGAVILAALERPAFARTPYIALDLALLAALAAIALQILPLPASVRLVISPASPALLGALLLNAPLDPIGAPPRPLSIDPAATLSSLVLVAALMLLFWCGRAVLARGGTRLLTRGIAWLGLALAAIAILQHATAPRTHYWYFRPIYSWATPFGPYLNRNDFAAWLVMAIPLTIGYVIARIRSRQRSDEGPIDLESILDPTALWLGASVCLMTAGLLVSLSRSGLVATATAMLTFLWVSRGRMANRGRAWLLAGLALAVTVAAVYANWSALASRAGETLTAGIGGRRAIWRETWVMVRDFQLAGIGVGTYQTGMLVYQQSPRTFYFNHAHNWYLQILAEGGLMLALPVLFVAIAGLRALADRLRSDRTAMFWIRAGATSGIVAMGVVCIWDRGLLMPANAALFALLAAVALHEERVTLAKTTASRAA